MKTTKILKWLPMLAVMFGICFAVAGCTEDDGGNEQSKEIYPQEIHYTEHTYTETELKECVNITLEYGEEKKIIINSQEELENIFCEANMPFIDFTKSTLLIYAFKTGSALEKADKKITNLSKNEYECKIKALQYSPYSAVSLYCFVAVVDKIPTDATVVFLFDENIN